MIPERVCMKIFELETCKNTLFKRNSGGRPTKGIKGGDDGREKEKEDRGQKSGGGDDTGTDQPAQGHPLSPYGPSGRV